jgi:hypothetical protein
VSTGALERVLRRTRTDREQAAACDLCAARIAADHRHLLDTDNGGLLCACRPCSMLFEPGAQTTSSNRHYRLVPQRRTRLAAVPTGGLGVPVGLAFFVRHRDGAVVAHYPSPMGATQWEVDAEAWSEVVDACPPLGQLRPDVEAFLINTARGAGEYWLVPIDECFRLVALIRREWRGWSGGATVWRQIEEFFNRLGTGRRS